MAVSIAGELSAIISRAGRITVCAAEEFFFSRIRNPHTRAPYLHAVKMFLIWAEARGLNLAQIAPKDVGQDFDDGLRKEKLSISTRKQHLAALRHFFDNMVVRHAIFF